MENAVDALKIAFAVFIFVIALTLAFSVVGQARATSDTVLALNDKTSLYDYVDESESNAKTKDRIVGFETILPTIYRYAKEQYAVTILQADGKPIVRYDLYTEGFMGNWDTILKEVRKAGETTTYTEIKNRIAEVDRVIEDETGKTNAIWNSLVTSDNYPGELYSGINQNLSNNNNNNNNNVAVAPWMGDPNTDVIDRIKADIDGSIYEKNNIEYSGKNLNQFKDKKFKEKFIEIQTSGTTITEQDEENNIEYSLETVRGNKKLEIIYILQ